MLNIQNLEKKFGETLVLKNINLEIENGEFITLVGESGSGKSTLLRIIAGLETQTQGSLLLNGVDISKRAPKDRDMAMVFQSYALYPHLTVKENLATPLVARGKFLYKLPFATKFSSKAKQWRKDIDEKVKEVADGLKISHLLDRKPKALSGGQCQRVALGRAMIRKPKAFLMDEPLSNLDAKLRVHMRNELTQLHRKLGITFIYVTHDQVEAMTMSDRIAFLVDGNLLQVDTPDNMYNNPNHIKVAEFIGTPKINTAKAIFNGGDIIFENDFSKKDEQDYLIFALRPEYTRVDNSSRYKAKVKNIENMGNEYIIHVKTKFANSHFAIKATPAEAKGVKIGDEIRVGMELDKALYFDQKGNRVYRVDKKEMSA
ncbi:MAG: ABC transporter ATP-binding protein [Campylobacteraceae bacterium]|nr:ABC transporter ATP-binding protein [Campylobacteraceae bacterium]